MSDSATIAATAYRIACWCLAAELAKNSCVSDSKARIGAANESLERCGMSDGKRSIEITRVCIAVLRLPHVFVDIAAAQQFVVGADVVDLAFFHHEDGVGGDEHGQ